MQSKVNEFFVDISRKRGSRFTLNNLMFGYYDWELREGEIDNATTIESWLGVSTSGSAWTIKGAEACAARAKRKVLKERSRRKDWIPRRPV